jgi:probable F420-dependent oxidoreductase
MTGEPPITFGVQAGQLANGANWRELAIKAEDLGFEALYVADHVGVTASPFAALAAAASATTSIRLGTFVLNAGVRDPVAIASDIATLDVISDGRAILGLGAGHTPGEWTMLGRTYPPAAERVGRLSETVAAVSSLLEGKVVTQHGRFLQLHDASLRSPRPVQPHVPLLVGGYGRRVMRLAGATADIASLTGLGRTLADGHHHVPEWSGPTIDERVAIVREAAARRGDDGIVLNALVQHLQLTTSRDEAAEQFARTVPGLTLADVHAAPYALIGSPDQLIEDLVDYRTRWGFTSYVIRADVMDTAADLATRLRAK